MKTAEKKERLLKTKIAVALHDEYKRVPTEEEISSVFHLTGSSRFVVNGPAEVGIHAAVRAALASRIRAR
jgi:hypothetical protein